MRTSGMIDDNAIVQSTPVAGMLAYVHGLKQRAKRHHCVGYGVFRANVEELGRLRREYSRRIRPITTLPILVKATALAVAMVPEANSVLFKALLGHRVVRFADVDVNVPVTRLLDGELVTFLVIVRRANLKTLAEIQDQLQHALQAPPAEVPEIERVRKARRFPRLGWRLYHWLMTRSPRFYARNGGTCALTVMNESWGDVFFPIGPTTCVLSVGGTRAEAVVEGDRIVARRVMHICLAADNYVLSGPQGAAVAKAFQAALQDPRFIRAELAAAS
jgi:pyruvate/2-oxoglutarate dehydrogenase complex dihydrolipoamide acyltransferase (E2) component